MIGGFFEQLSAGTLGPLTILFWLMVAFLCGIAGGALCGVKIAGKDLGNELAALMGGLYGPAAALPGVLIGLLIIVLIR